MGGKLQKDTQVSIIGKNPLFLSEINKIPSIARYNSTVLILGETGTGKEVVAQAIHRASPRKGPFIPINCGAIPVNLVENELFGHRNGAFTGASKTKTGLIEEAQNGTLFLDEIDSLPLIAQVKLLRFLQEKTYRPLGSTKQYQAKVRIITATNRELKNLVESGTIRQDLFYRISVVNLSLPPLRERREDIPLLARYFLGKYTLNNKGNSIRDFTDDALRILMLYDWPGNVRELQHVIERAAVFCNNTLISAKDLNLPSLEQTIVSMKVAKARIVQEFEKNYLTELLIQCEGNVSEAARKSEKDRRALLALLKKNHINPEKFRNMKVIAAYSSPLE